MASLQSIAARGLTAGILALTATACSLTDAKLEVIDNLYQSLPQENRNEYAAAMFLDTDYDTQITTIKDIVDNGELQSSDNAYIGDSVLMHLMPEERTAVMEAIMDKSDYNVQRELTFYGIEKLDTGDLFQAVANSGVNILSEFGKKVKDAYQSLFGVD